jgi:phenylpropionate dioxygenase-like ring-hydroxylating dioxygenase large terminal subunit
MAFLRNTWYVAMWGQDLDPGQLEQRVICDEPIVIYRQADGTAAALADQCAHRFAPLSRGKLCGDNGDHVECPYHGLQYDADGTCVVNPHGTGRIPAALHIRSYPIVERHTILWIWMGDQPADADLIPDFSHLDENAPGIVSKRDWMVIDVDYRLMADNLLDLSHVNFLHDGLLGHPDMNDAEVDLRDVVEPSGAETHYVTRTVRNVRPPMLFDLMYRNDNEPVDVWAEMRWNAPGCLRNHSGATQPGAPREEGMTVIGSHLLTPINEHQMRYHIAAVQLGGTPAGETPADVADQLSRLRRFAFEEQDRPMVEAQQLAYDRAGGPENLKPVMLSIDAAPLRARRTLARLIADEQPNHPVTISA